MNTRLIWPTLDDQHPVIDLGNEHGRWHGHTGPGGASYAELVMVMLGAVTVTLIFGVLACTVAFVVHDLEALSRSRLAGGHPGPENV